MTGDDTATTVEVVLRAARVFAAVTAESIARSAHGVTLPQLRVLTVASEVGSLNNADVARTLNIHISNASRLCERLVQAGLLNRRDNPADRRQVDLTLTDAGRALVEGVTEHRREAFTAILAAMSPSDRADLCGPLTAFVSSGEQRITGASAGP
ncbi:MAG TPA: MarR family transcriptional regulator [Microlunatus sp.]|nr:MarR family transcriptional regulator [Microlunatus sp.]